MNWCISVETFVFAGFMWIFFQCTGGISEGGEVVQGGVLSDLRTQSHNQRQAPHSQQDS